MSAESAKAFLHELDSDRSLRAELLASGGENAEEITLTAERLVELGSQRGFAFTLVEIRAALAERDGSRSRELDDRALEAVAGGGKVQLQDFHFTVRVDKASPVL